MKVKVIRQSIEFKNPCGDIINVHISADDGVRLTLEMRRFDMLTSIYLSPVQAMKIGEMLIEAAVKAEEQS